MKVLQKCKLIKNDFRLCNLNSNWILSWQSLNIFADLRPPLVCNYPEIRGLHRLTEIVVPKEVKLELIPDYDLHFTFRICKFRFL